MIDWKDETSYSKGEYKKVSARLLKTKIADITISIHRHIYDPESWFLSCHDLKIDKENLYTNDFKEAETKAIKILLTRLSKYADMYKELIAL